MKRACNSGFTILEVLVALGIFALAAVVLAGAYINVLNGYEAAKRATVSDPDVQFARSQLLAQADVELARQGGEFAAPDGRAVRWTATIDPTESADLFLVTFECDIAANATVKEQKVQQVFRVLRPTWSVATDRATLRAAAKDRILKIQESVNK
ncbi:MAG: prepilin-type N-terminal cleavage/methylation domain-containing protein [Rariglobus sp.]|nr:prepilin-type N-terminal cleavage/methylation domain-containing protein [Rariglobus sp.]